MNLFHKLFYKFNHLMFKEIRKNNILVKINTSFSRGSVTASLRNIDPAKPETWEFSAFSQNGEDGIIDYLIDNLTESNRYFIEIGANNCVDNNTGWLAYGRNFAGLMIEGDNYLYKTSYDTKPWYTDYLNQFVTRENISQLDEKVLYKNPDLLSLDIDGNDFYIMERLFESGYRPKIAVVEYNSCFGPDQSLTIRYREDFNCAKAHSTALYYGVSITLWRQLFEGYGYKFVSVDKNGVNAFFVDPACFKTDFLRKIQPVAFKENLHQLRTFKKGWDYQFSLISNMLFHSVNQK